MHVLIFIFDLNFILMWFELGFDVNMQVGKLEEWSQGENRGKQWRKAKTQGISHHPTPWCEIWTTLPPCAKLPLWAFSKNHALGPYPKSQCENHKNANIVRNSHHPISATVGHISITSRSSFHEYYISFKILGSQESIASNSTRFGVETKKLWPFEDDCAKLNGNVAAAPISLLLDMFLEHFLELKLCIPYVVLNLRKSEI